MKTELFGFRDHTLADRMGKWFELLESIYRKEECVKRLAPTVLALIEYKYQHVLKKGIDAFLETPKYKYPLFGYAALAEGAGIPALCAIYRDTDFCVLPEVVHNPGGIWLPGREEMSEREWVEFLYRFQGIVPYEDELDFLNTTKFKFKIGYCHPENEKGSAFYDPTISLRHRKWGWRLAAYDLDHIMMQGVYIRPASSLFMEMKYGVVCALVNYKNISFAGEWSQEEEEEQEYLEKGYTYLADGIDVPSFQVWYRERDFAMCVVANNQHAQDLVGKNPIWKSEKEWVTLMYDIRGLYRDSSILDTLNTIRPEQLFGRTA